ncbi:hypothetical protein Tco_1227925 [Tanacetum coccineum]
MGAALLSEMNVSVADEDIEAIVDKASCYLAVRFPIEKAPTKRITDFNGLFNKKNVSKAGVNISGEMLTGACFITGRDIPDYTHASTDVQEKEA